MNIGVFDSGLGGLIMTRALTSFMPEYNFVYFGDTVNVPYGNKSPKLIEKLTFKNLNYMIQKNNCALIVLACNTASFAVVDKWETYKLARGYKNIHLIGVIDPTVEETIKRNYNSVGIIATNATINSGMYKQKLLQKKPDIKVYSLATPLLVPLIEYEGDYVADMVLKSYLLQFKGTDIEAIILGCTHYPYYKDRIKQIATEIMERNIDIISQDEFIPATIEEYLNKNPLLEKSLTKNKERQYFTTDMNDGYLKLAEHIINFSPLRIEKIS